MQLRRVVCDGDGSGCLRRCAVTPADEDRGHFVLGRTGNVRSYDLHTGAPVGAPLATGRTVPDWRVNQSADYVFALAGFAAARNVIAVPNGGLLAVFG